MEYTTKNAEETQKLGEGLGAHLAHGEVLALVGELGSGKTTFVQGLARGLGVKQQIISPTFIIVREYQGESLKLYHVDLYRLEGDLKKELDSLGLTDIWEDPANVIVIEWAEKAKDYLPEVTKWVRFGSLGENGRKIVIEE